MRFYFSILFILLSPPSPATTIGIIDTGFDLDHEFLKPKIFKQDTDEEAISWQFHDNSHLKEPVIKDQSLLEEILQYRNMRAKGHTEGLSRDEFEWFNKKSSDKFFLTEVKKFKKHSHGTFVAGIALREGENISIFPIRGLHIPTPVVKIEDTSTPPLIELKSKTPEEKFKEEVENSADRVVKKFSKICRYLSLNGINVVNASYGITYKAITTKFRERYKHHTATEILEPKLQKIVKTYFDVLQDRTSKIIQKYSGMLFVFSAGNSGLDNDLYDHYPSKIKLPNTLSVGAMNGDFLASFSNYGVQHVDVGAPGVAILSLVPQVYSKNGQELYSPSSGTSMAAPYVSNLAAQLLNLNPKLKPQDVKKIIMDTGDEKDHLKTKLISGSIVNNQKAIKAALLSKDIPLETSITLAKSGLIPMEESVSSELNPHINTASLQQKVMDVIPKNITPDEIEEIQTTSEEFSSPLDAEKDKQGNSSLLPLTESDLKPINADPVPSNQSGEQSPLPYVDLTPSSSQALPQSLQTQDSELEPSLP